MHPHSMFGSTLASNHQHELRAGTRPSLAAAVIVIAIVVLALELVTAFRPTNAAINGIQLTSAPNARDFRRGTPLERLDYEFAQLKAASAQACG